MTKLWASVATGQRVCRTKHLPEPQRKFGEFAKRIHGGSAVDRKTKELIAVAASSVGRCPHCTEGHLAAAKEHGATEAEIAEALGVLLVIASGVQVVWDKDDFEMHLGEGGEAAAD